MKTTKKKILSAGAGKQSNKKVPPSDSKGAFMQVQKKALGKMCHGGKMKKGK